MRTFYSSYEAKCERTTCFISSCKKKKKLVSFPGTIRNSRSVLPPWRLPPCGALSLILLLPLFRVLSPSPPAATMAGGGWEGSRMCRYRFPILSFSSNNSDLGLVRLLLPFLRFFSNRRHSSCWTEYREQGGGAPSVCACEEMQWGLPRVQAGWDQ